MVRQVTEVGEEASVWIEYRTVANAPPDAKRVKTHNEHQMIDVIRDLRDLTEITEYFRSLHNGSSIITTEEGKVIF